jgi:hypothetical protein
MAEPTTQELIDSMTAPSTSRMAQLASVMSGTGAETVALFRDISSAVSQLPGLGLSAAEKIRTTRADTSLPQAHRLKLVNETRDVTRVVIQKLHDGAQAKAVQLERAFEDGVIPHPHRDVAMRQLAREELRNVVQGKAGSDLTSALRKHIGNNAAHDAEIVSEFGRSLLAGHGEAQSFDSIRARVVEKYAAASGGTEKQIASRRALAAFRKANVPGAVAAHFQVARMHMGEDK